MSKETTKEETWKIKRTEETESIFDLYLNLCLTREKAVKLSDEIDLIKKRMEFEKANMWTEIEKHLGLLGKDVGLTLDRGKSDGEELVIHRDNEKRIAASPSDILKRLLGEN